MTWGTEHISDIGDHEPVYNVEWIHYRDVYGHLLFKEPMIFNRLFGVGDDIVEDSEKYIVMRVAVADNVQHINVRKV